LELDGGGLEERWCERTTYMVCSMGIFKNIQSRNMAAKVLDVEGQYLYKAMKKRNKLFMNLEHGFIGQCIRKVDSLGMNMKELVQASWNSNFTQQK
jgi:hypothetical protein